MKQKNELIRITKLKDGTFTLDEKAQGRGAYICNDSDCVNKCQKRKLLHKAFKMNIPEQVYIDILEENAKHKQD